MGRLKQDEFVVENFFFSIKKKATTASPFASIRVVLPASTPFPMSVSLKSDTCMSDRGSRETKKPRSIGLESIRRGIGRILIWHVHRKHRLGFALCAVPFVFVKLGLFFQQNGCFALKQLPTMFNGRVSSAGVRWRLWERERPSREHLRDVQNGLHGEMGMEDTKQ